MQQKLHYVHLSANPYEQLVSNVYCDPSPVPQHTFQSIIGRTNAHAWVNSSCVHTCALAVMEIDTAFDWCKQNSIK